MLITPPFRWLSSPSKALDTRYFRAHPVCPENIQSLPPLELPTHGGSYHEFQTKRKRKEDGVMQQDAKRAQRKKVGTVTSTESNEHRVQHKGISQFVRLDSDHSRLFIALHSDT